MIDIANQIVDETRWSSVNIGDIIKQVTDITETHFGLDGKEISIVFTNDDLVHQLNKQYRGKDKSTNVLSFAFNDDGSDDAMLGEILLAYGVIEKESREQNKNFENHLTHLLIHGVLHLLGYDHIEDGEADKMEELEIELLKKLNIENPYKGD